LIINFKEVSGSTCHDICRLNVSTFSLAIMQLIFVSCKVTNVFAPCFLQSANDFTPSKFARMKFHTAQ